MAVHTIEEMARYWNHPDVAALRAQAYAIDTQSMSAKAAREAMRVPLNAICDKVSELKARMA